MNRRQLLRGIVPAALCAQAFGQQAPATTGRGNEILLGQTADLSASRAGITKSYARGAALHFDALNARGGVEGRRIRVLQLDDAYDAGRALDNARQLVEREQVFALIQPVGTGITDQLMPFAQSRGVPVIHPLSGADHLRAPQREPGGTFLLRASYGREIERIIGHLTTVGITRIGLMHEDEPFGKSIKSAVDLAMARHKLSLAALGVLPPNQTRPEAVLPAVQQMARAAPNVVLLGSAGPALEHFLRAYRETGQPTQYYGISVTNVDRLYQALGPASRGIIVSQVMPAVRRSNLPIVRDYREAAAARGQEADSFGLEGFISARAIESALRRAGAAPTRARFVEQLAGLNELGGFPLRSQSGPHSGSPYVELAMIGDDGKLVL